MIFVKQIN